MTKLYLPTPTHRGDFILFECQQGSPEWLACRAGVVTASEFKKARNKVNGLTSQQAAYVAAIQKGMDEAMACLHAGYKKKPTADVVQRALDGEKVGEWGETALDYAFQKAVERISRVPLDENYQTWQMKRGQLLEPKARMKHEDLLNARAAAGTNLADLIVEQAGFMTTPDGLFGCSVDGLIGEHGGSEYKCLSSAKTLRKVIIGRDISDYIDQVQGCMWISGRRWWHFGLYCPALEPVGLEFQMTEVQRDDDYIDALQADLLEFVELVGKYEDELRTLGAAAVEEAAEAVRLKLAEEVRIEYDAEEFSYA